jgi:hypothetical protein
LQALPKKGGLGMSAHGTPKNKSQIDRRIDRRIDFLIREAKSEDTIPDQAITYAFRVITNYLSVGCDARSRKLSLNCRCRSKKAQNLFLLLKAGEGLKAREEWLDKVTNEHQYPIKRAWEWMKKERDKLTVQRVKGHLKKWPIVVVTKEENKSLKHDSAIRPNQRYRDAGIEVIKRNRSGDWPPI